MELETIDYIEKANINPLMSQLSSALRRAWIYRRYGKIWPQEIEDHEYRHFYVRAQQEANALMDNIMTMHRFSYDPEEIAKSH